MHAICARVCVYVRVCAHECVHMHASVPCMCVFVQMYTFVHSFEVQRGSMRLYICCHITTSCRHLVSQTLISQRGYPGLQQYRFLHHSPLPPLPPLQSHHLLHSRHHFCAGSPWSFCLFPAAVVGKFCCCYQCPWNLTYSRWQETLINQLPSFFVVSPRMSI